MKKCRMNGFTLIEVAIFIVTIGILVGTVLLPISEGLVDTDKQFNGVNAIALAQERMELILANRRAVGFSTLADPCSLTPSAANCVAPTGFTVTSTIASSGTYQKNVTVTVSGFGDAELETLVATF